MSKLLLGAVKLALGDLGQAEMYLSSVVAAEPDNVSGASLAGGNPTASKQAGGRARRRSRPCSTSPMPARSCSRLRGERAWPRARLRNGLAVSGSVAQRLQPADVGAQLDLVAGYVAAGQFDEARAVLNGLPADSEAIRRAARSCRCSRNSVRATRRRALETARAAAGIAEGCDDASVCRRSLRSGRAVRRSQEVSAADGGADARRCGSQVGLGRVELLRRQRCRRAAAIRARAAERARSSRRLDRAGAGARRNRRVRPRDRGARGQPARRIRIRSKRACSRPSC